MWDNKEWGYPNSMHGAYTFSLKNNLRESVGDVYCLVVFYDSQGNPLDISVVNYRQTIPPGLARRVSGKVDGSVQRMTTGELETKPGTRIEFRILDFSIEH